jgi:hypothetical protein
MVNSPAAEAQRSVWGRPPGPRGLPLVGNLLALGNEPLGFFAETARRYGDLVQLNLAGWQTLLVSDLPAIEKILVEDHRNYVKQVLLAPYGGGVRKRPAHQ